MKAILAHCDTQTDAEAIRRREFAHRTRPEWCRPPIPPQALPRLFDDGSRTLPFVKDVVNTKLSWTPDADVIVLTNSDICFAPTFQRRLHAIMDMGIECCYAHRQEFTKLEKPLTDEEVAQGTQYPGIDLFAFRKNWWLDHESELPDMVMGAEAWDLCLRELMHRHSVHAGVPSLPNAIYHEAHDSTWCRPENIGTLPSQLHNLALAREFLKGQPELEALLVPNRPT